MERKVSKINKDMVQGKSCRFLDRVQNYLGNLAIDKDLITLDRRILTDHRVE